MMTETSKIPSYRLVLDLPPWTGNSRHSYKMKRNNRKNKKKRKLLHRSP
jgi:hypothetical protein